MVNAQQWLSRNYPKNNRQQIKKIDLSNQNLEGHLALKDFSNLEELDASNNQITTINFADSLSGKKKQKLEWKLKSLSLSNNSFFEQDLSCLKKLTELEELSIANNKFSGSLEPLKNMTKLKKLDISDTDLDSGLEYLPESLEEVNCSFKAREDAKVQSIEQILKNNGSKKHDNSWVVNIKELKAKLLSKEIYELCQATESDDAETIANILVANQIIINSLDKNGNVALHYAVSNENWEATEVLLQNEANPNIQDKDGLTPLHLATANNYQQITKKLLKHNANPNIQDNKGNTPLHFAAEQNNLEILKLLVNNPRREQKGDINIVNKHNWSVLHGAALGIINEKEDWEIIKWLLEERRADTDVKDSNDFSVRDVFAQKDWSYAACYDELLQETKKIEPKQLEIPHIKK